MSRLLSLKCKQKLRGFPEDKNFNRRKVLICQLDTQKKCLKWFAKRQIQSANCDLQIANSNPKCLFLAPKYHTKMKITHNSVKIFDTVIK